MRMQSYYMVAVIATMRKEITTMKADTVSTITEQCTDDKLLTIAAAEDALAPR